MLHSAVISTKSGMRVSVLTFSGAIFVSDSKAASASIYPLPNFPLYIGFISSMLKGLYAVIKRDFNSSLVKPCFPKYDAISAAIPETCGQAIDVPCR